MNLGKQYLKLLVLSVIVGVVSGLGALLFYYGLHIVTAVMVKGLCGLEIPSPKGEVSPFEFKLRLTTTPLIRILVPCLGGLISGLLVYSFAPEAEGHGTDAVIDAFHRLAGRIRRRVPVIKTLASIITIGSGGSAGREGPIAQIGAGFASVLSEVLGLGRREREILLICGASAGVGSIFKAPFGGSIFGIEVLYMMDYEVEALLPAVISTFTAYGIFCSVTGWTPIFIASMYSYLPGELPLFLLLGLITGLLSTLYVESFYKMREVFKSLKVPMHVKPAIGGLLLGILSLKLPHVLGSSYGWVQLSLEEKLTAGLMIAIMFGKILATDFTIGSGGSGGVFAPSLVIGCMAGGVFGTLVKMVFPNLVTNIAVFSVVGMGSFFAAAGKVPIASIIMVAEMSGEYKLLMPAFLAATISYYISGKWSIYESQLTNKLESPVHLGEVISAVTGKRTVLRDKMSKMLKAMKIGEIMTKDVICVQPDVKLSKLYTLIFESGHHGFPVVKDGRLIGMVTLDDLRKTDRKKWEKLSVGDVMCKRLYTVYPSDTIIDALRLMYRERIGRLLVVDEENPRKLVGIVTKKDILRAYNTALLLAI